MKHRSTIFHLVFLLSAGMFFILTSSTTLRAGTPFYSYGTIPRYNVVPPPVYRHYEDTRRYNAAPNRFGYASSSYSSSYQNSCNVCKPAPVKIKTVVVSQRCQRAVIYDACGTRKYKTMTVTLYKDVYSDGRSRIWQHIAYGE